MTSIKWACKGRGRNQVHTAIVSLDVALHEDGPFQRNDDRVLKLEVGAGGGANGEYWCGKALYGGLGPYNLLFPYLWRKSPEETKQALVEQIHGLSIALQRLFTD